MREKCPNTGFFRSVFFHVRTEYGKIFPYSVRTWKNTDRKKPVFGHFSRIALMLYYTCNVNCIINDASYRQRCIVTIKIHRKTPVPGLRPATPLKKRLWCECFLMAFAKHLRWSFFLTKSLAYSCRLY